MEQKTILWQAHEGNVSGANIAMLEFMDALKNDYVFWVILPHSGSMVAELKKRDISLSVIHQYGWTNSYPVWNIWKWIKVIYRSIRAISQTKKLIQKIKPSVVCTNTLVPFTASISAKQMRVPHVWWIHEFGKEDFGFTTGWGYEKKAMRWMQSSSKLIIGNSKAISAKFAKLMPKANIVTIYQPVSWHTYTETETTKKARFLMFGQLVASKGHKDVLEAMLANKQAGKPLHSLHIIGPSEIKSYLDELQQFVQQNDLQEYVQIEAGYFKKEAVMPQYEVLIVASQAEAFGRVIVEANKAGLHILVRNSGGAPELINESNGLLFNNENELAAVLSGERKFPFINIRMNYEEADEITKLINLLQEVCL